MLVGDSGRITGNSQVILHSRAMLAEMFLQTALGAMIQFHLRRAGSNGRRNTIWYKSVFKGGVYEARETVWAFHGAEDRFVASLEGGSDVA
jgi:hypothetical protein